MTGVFWQPECAREQPDRFLMRPPDPAAFEVADGADTQPGMLGQLFLG
jgi:hypothetical protein